MLRNPEDLWAFLEGLGLGKMPPGWSEAILLLHRKLVAANRMVNLTRLVSDHDFLVKHVADSLLAAHAWPPLQTRALRVADVGCGGGFPGLPLALTFPLLQLAEIDSRGKKVKAVAEIAAALGLSNVTTLAARARELGHRAGHRAAYDLVTARAVSDTPSLIQECRRLLAPGGMLLAFRTPASLQKESEATISEAEREALTWCRSPVYALPDDAGERQFWLLAAEAAAR